MTTERPPLCDCPMGDKACSYRADSGSRCEHCVGDCHEGHKSSRVPTTERPLSAASEAVKASLLAVVPWWDADTDLGAIEAEVHERALKDLEHREDAARAAAQAEVARLREALMEAAILVCSDRCAGGGWPPDAMHDDSCQQRYALASQPAEGQE